MQITSDQITNPFAVARYANTVLKILLPDDAHTLIDDADELLIAGFPWRVLQTKDLAYVHAWHGCQHFYMHRLIVGAGPKQMVDHWDGNGLNNQRLNLRIATGGQNQANAKKRSGCTSPYKGVFWDSHRQRWSACIKSPDGKRHSLGRFTDEIEAAKVYDAAAAEYWGRFARLNFPGPAQVLCGRHVLGIMTSPCSC